MRGHPDQPEAEGESAASPLRSLEAVLPLVAFLVANRFGGLRWAVAATSLASLKVAVDRRRRDQPLGAFVPILTVAIISRGAIGIVTDSEAVYFGLGIATRYLVAAVLIGSALVNRPLAGRFAPHVFNVDTNTQQHRTWKSTMSTLTVIGGLYFLASATVDTLLFRHTAADGEVEGYVLIRFLANWPLTMVAAGAAAWVMHRRLPQIPGIASLESLILND